jgi:hypothetical protein
MLSNNPVEASITRRLEFPYETKGSGTPVSGASPMTANRLTIAWITTIEVRPAASSLV